MKKELSDFLGGEFKPPVAGDLVSKGITFIRGKEFKQFTNSSGDLFVEFNGEFYQKSLFEREQILIKLV